MIIMHINRFIKATKYIGLSFKMLFSGHRFVAALWAIALFLPAALSVIINVVYSQFIDEVSELLEENITLALPLLWLGLYLVFRGINFTFANLKSIAFDRIAREADTNMLLYMCERTAKLKQINFDSAEKYDQIKGAISSELSLWGLNWMVVSAISSLITIVGICIITIPYSIELTFLTIALSIPVFLMNIRLSLYDNKMAQVIRRQHMSTEYYGNLLCRNDSMKEMKLFGSVRFFLERWKNSLREEKKHRVRYSLIGNSIKVLLYIIELLCFLTVLYICSADVINQSITIGEFTLYTTNFALLFAMLQEISDSMREILHSSDEYDLFVKFTDSTSEGERTGEEFKNGSTGINIEFVDVSFSYGGERVLNKVSFTWHQGERIALIGRNGSGKSTLIKLICGLYSPDEGEILINGRNASEYSQESLYRLFGVVYQDFCHYAFSLRENVAAQDLNRVHDDSDIKNALKRSSLSIDDQELKRGLDTPVGRVFDEDGIELSGGQWQKIAVARNWFSSRPILIFDEAASAMDSKSENQLLQEIMDNSQEWCSVMIISHRLGIGKIADRIFLLEQGSIVENGTHEELMHLNGKYAELYKTQAKLYGKEMDS